MCQCDCFHMCMYAPIWEAFYNGYLNVCVYECIFCICVCMLKCVFGALFLLSIHLRQSHPSICRLPSPPYHLSSSLLHSSHPCLLSHTSLSHQAPHPTSSQSPTHHPILGITIPCCCYWTKNMHVC